MRSVPNRNPSPYLFKPVCLLGSPWQLWESPTMQGTTQLPAAATSRFMHLTSSRNLFDTALLPQSKTYTSCWLLPPPSKPFQPPSPADEMLQHGDFERTGNKLKLFPKSHSSTISWEALTACEEKLSLWLKQLLPRHSPGLLLGTLISSQTTRDMLVLGNLLSWALLPHAHWKHKKMVPARSVPELWTEKHRARTLANLPESHTALSSPLSSEESIQGTAGCK